MAARKIVIVLAILGMLVSGLAATGNLDGFLSSSSQDSSLPCLDCGGIARFLFSSPDSKNPSSQVNSVSSSSTDTTNSVTSGTGTETSTAHTDSASTSVSSNTNSTTMSSNTDSTTYSQPNFNRVVISRVYQQKQWTLPSENPVTVAQAIASLNPTFVTGLIRLSDTTNLTSQMIVDYNTIRDLVLQANPNTKFDIVLNANEYNTSAELITKFQAINSQIHVDAFYFDFYMPGYQAHPQVVEDAISYAHSQGQFVGGDVFGGVGIPPASDYVVCCEANFTIDAGHLAHLRSTLGPNFPILVHINNNPQGGPTTECCVFMNSYNTEQRIAYIIQLAENQAPLGYVLEYSPFFPMCPTSNSYDALQDGPMFATIQTLMNQYNPSSS